MPELPDVAAYLSALEPRIVGQPLLRAAANPFLLRHRRASDRERRWLRRLRAAAERRKLHKFGTGSRQVCYTCSLQ